MKRNLSEVSIAVTILLIVLLIIIPLPTPLIDLMLILNMTLSITILLISIYAREALDFSSFPTVLLLATIFRMALNVSTTRQILGNNGDAGKVVETFGNFVGGGQLVVGFIVFIIIMLAQFLVITKGSERVAEVTARFTLDAMPGKQMAIDADLSSGLINEDQARERRAKIQRESDFYGAMDGASKFVKGDAILGILTTIVNAVGGIIIGTVMGTMEMDQVLRVYTIATIGDGLVSQIPALMISTATGIIVTKATSEESMSVNIIKQMTGQPMVIMLAGGAIAVMSILPGMPWYTMIPVGTLLVVIGFIALRNEKPQEEASDMAEIEMAAEETRKPENVVSLLQVDPIGLEFGYGIIPLADASQGGDLLDRVVMIRRQCAIDLGMIVPVIHLRDNIQFPPNHYSIKIKGNEVAAGDVMLDHYLAMNPGDITEDIEGIDTLEPAFGLPAKWVNERQRERAELLGYTIVDPPSVIATHLTEVVRRHAHELLSRQQVQMLVENLRESQPSLVDEVVPKMFTLGEVQKVLANLLREGISIRDMGTILETMSDYGNITRDPDMLTEYVRQALKRTITRCFVQGNKARVLTLDPNLEHLILDHVRQGEHGTYLSLESDSIQKIFLSLKNGVEKITSMGISPVVLTSPVVRYHFKKLVEQIAPDLVVLSYNELEQNVDIQADGVVSI